MFATAEESDEEVPSDASDADDDIEAENLVEGSEDSGDEEDSQLIMQK